MQSKEQDYIIVARTYEGLERLTVRATTLEEASRGGREARPGAELVLVVERGSLARLPGPGEALTEGADPGRVVLEQLRAFIANRPEEGWEQVDDTGRPLPPVGRRPKDTPEDEADKEFTPPAKAEAGKDQNETPWQVGGRTKHRALIDAELLRDDERTLKDEVEGSVMGNHAPVRDLKRRNII